MTDTRKTIDKRNTACRELSDLEREITVRALAGDLPRDDQRKEHTLLWEIIDAADMAIADAGCW